jgi:hypothetical protein
MFGWFRKRPNPPTQAERLVNMWEIIYTTARCRQSVYIDKGLGWCSEHIAQKVHDRYMKLPLAVKMNIGVIDKVLELFEEEEYEYIQMMEVLKKEYGM